MTGPEPRPRRLSLRSAALLVHRYVGLLLAVFLLVAGLTGSVIAFYPQLDAALNPSFLRLTPAPGARLLDPFELQNRLRAQLPPQTPLDGVLLDLKGDEPANYWVDDREVFVDPYTGKVLESRKFGDFTEGRKTFLTFIYRLHFSLGLEEVGTWLMGGLALLWAFDCFVGLYLTFPLPAARSRPTRRGWLRRWLPAWLLKTSKLFSLVFTWHRASGLWVWGMLSMFAWSAVALNLHDQVYEPVMHAVFGAAPHAGEQLPKLRAARKTPRLEPRAAYEIGRRLMRSQAQSRGFELLGERWLNYDPEHGSYAYTVESTLDLSERLAETTVYFDGDTGELRGFEAPTGQHAGSTLTSWLVALHFGSWRFGGFAYRCFVCACGLLVSALSVSGAWIWLKKRRQRSREAAPRSGYANYSQIP